MQLRLYMYEDAHSSACLHQGFIISAYQALLTNFLTVLGVPGRLAEASRAALWGTDRLMAVRQLVTAPSYSASRSLLMQSAGTGCSASCSAAHNVGMLLQAGRGRPAATS